MFKMTLRFKISVILFLIAIAPIAFVEVDSLMSLTQLIQDRSALNVGVNYEIVRTVVQAQTNQIRYASEYLAQNEAVKTLFFDQYLPPRVLQEMKQNHPEIDFIGLFSTQAEYLAGAGLSTNSYQETLSQWLQQQLATDLGRIDVLMLPEKDFDANYQSRLRQTYATTSGTVLILSEPVYDGSNNLGLLVTGKVLNFADNLFAEIKQAIGESKDIFFLADGKPVAASVTHSQFQAFMENFDTSKNIVKNVFHNQSTSQLQVSIKDRQMALGSTEQTMFIYLFVLALAGILISGSSAFILTGLVFQPMKSLVATMIIAEGGDLSVRADIDSNDELGGLARSFNSMTRQLQRSVQRETQYVKELASINDFGAAITSVLDLNILLDMVVDTTLKMMAVRRCSLWLVTPDGKALQNRKTRGIAIFDSIEKPTVSMGEGIVGKVAETCRALLINDLRHDERFSESENPEYYGVRSVLSVPLIALDQMIGVLNVSKETVNGFDDDDKNLLSTLAGQAGIAIHNANLYSQIPEKERIEGELEIYRKIQLRLIPSRSPNIKGLLLHSSMIPAKEVGGDYFDFIQSRKAGDESVGIVIGDVSGKGVSAGLVMMRTRTILHALSAANYSPRDALVYLNHYLASTVEVGKFMTLLYLLWDPNEKKMSYAAAGHEHILVYKAATGETVSLKSGGIAVGMVDDISSLTQEKELDVETGDAIVLYTDGVTEAENTANERYTLERLISVMDRNGMKPARELHKVIMDDLYRFIGGAEQWDDVTLLVMKVGEISAEHKQADEGEFFIDRELDLQFSSLEIKSDGADDHDDFLFGA